MTFTQVWDAVSQQFPNSLTSDSTSIKQALEIYGRPTSKGFRMLREEIKQHVNQHSEIIALLALIGRGQGYDIVIGRNEQGHRAGGLAPAEPLSKFMTARPNALREVKNLKTVLDMDLLWLDGDRVATAFEVESTTTMTSGLLRGSNLPAETPKIMVLPEDREADFRRKMESPLFREHFEKESWQRLYFGTLRRAFTKTRDATDLSALIDIGTPERKTGRVREEKQAYLNL